MEKVEIDAVESAAMGDGDLDRRGLSDPLGTSDVAINYYALEPSEAFSGGMHAHRDQEELFYVIEGTATFETKPEPTADSETVDVGPQEAVRFAPGEFQQGRNESDERVVALALGAPRESRDVVVPEPCRDCGESEVLAFAPTDEGVLLQCPECGMELEPDL
jgi:uncharacterized cupin superfamily protein